MKNNPSYREYKKDQARKAARLAKQKKARIRRAVAGVLCFTALLISVFAFMKKDEVGIRTHIVLPGDTAYAISEQAKIEVQANFNFKNVEVSWLDVEYLDQLEQIKPGDIFSFHIEQSLFDKLLNQATLGVEFIRQP